MNERTIFSEALNCGSEAERSAYLDEACAGSSKLRQRVEALLRSHDSGGDFLDKPVPQRIAEALDAGGAQARTRSEGSGGLAEAVDFLAPPEKPEQLGRLGHYEVHKIIGRGGMGIVLKAFDQRLHRFVAIKALAPHLATSAAARQRFVREARAAAAVRNEHVIDIHAVEEVSPTPYLVMEYVSGVSLQDRLDHTGPLDLKTILRIGMQIAAGLTAAHAQGLVHRDVKPANILLENGVERVKITDFGLARAADDCSLTQSGVIAGTPHYMAPEQAGGVALDHRADLFSLGSLLYALCTGRPPFRADGTMAVLKRVCEDTPRPIREINAEIPEWLDAIVARLHEKDPAKRFQSASEVGELLSQHLAHLQQPALVPFPAPANGGRKPPVASETGGSRPQLARSRRWLAVAALVLAFFGAVGLTEATGVTKVVATVVHILTADGTLVVESEDPGVKVSVEGDGGLVITGAGPREVRLRPGSYRLLATRDGKVVKTELVTIARRGRQVVRISLEPPDPAGVVASAKFTPPPPGALDALDPAKIPSQERFAWQPKELVQVLGAHGGRHWGIASCAAFRPDGKVIASGGYFGVIHLWDAKTLRELASLTGGHTKLVRGIAFSADGKFLLSGAEDRSVCLWDLTAGKLVRRFEGHTGYVMGVALSADGKRGLSGGGTGDDCLRLWNLETGERLLLLQGHTAAVIGVALSADGQKAISCSLDKTVRLWDLKTGKESRCFEGHTDGVTAVALSPDGRLALSGGGPNDPTVRLWDLEKGEHLRTFTGHADQVHGVAFSPDGRKALSTEGGWNVGCRLWDVENGKELLRFAPVGNYGVNFSPDGRRAVTANHGVQLWDLETGKELCPQPGHPCHARGVAFSPDGRHLLSCSDHDRAVLLWDVATGQVVRRFEGHTAPVHGVAFSPDGQSALSGGQDGVMRAWDVATGKERIGFGQHACYINGVAYSPDGRQALSSGGDGARLYDVASGRNLRHFADHDKRTWSAAFSPDGRHLLSTRSGDSIAWWDVATGQELRRYPAPGVHYEAVFAPDGRSAFLGSILGTPWRLDLAAADHRQRTFDKWHADHVMALTVSPDSKTLATSGTDGRVILWEAATGTKVREWQLPGMVQGLAFAPDGRHLATANGNGTVYVLRLETTKPPVPTFTFTPPPPGPLDALDPARIPAAERFAFQPKEVVQVLGEHRGRQWDAPSCVAISRDGKRAASCGGWRNYTVSVWDASTMHLRTVLVGHTGQNWSVTFSPDGRRLISGGEDETVRLWDVDAGKELRCFKGHEGLVYAVAYSPDGRLALSGGRDKTVRLWDVDTGKQLACWKGHAGSINSVAFSPDGSQALSGGGSDDKTLRLWDVKTGKEVRVMAADSTDFRIVHFLPDGQRALSCSRDKTLRLWDLKTGNELRKYEGHADEVGYVAVSPDGRQAASGARDRTLRFWDVETGEQQQRLVLESPVGAVAFTPDGKRVVSGSWDGNLRTWDAGTGKEVNPRLGFKSDYWFVQRLAFSPDGRRLLHSLANDVALSWDVETGKEAQRFAIPRNTWGVSWSGDGQHGLTAGGGGAVLWDAATGKVVRRFVDAKGLWDAALSRDGRRAVTVNGDGLVQAWDVASGRELNRFREPTSQVYCVALSPDGRRAIYGARSGAVVLWDPEASREVYRHQGHGRSVWGAAYAPDGRHAATAGDDGFVRLWDLTGAEPRMRPLAKWHTGEVRSVAFSPDAATLMSAGVDGQVIAWDVATGEKRREWQMQGHVLAVAYAPDGRHTAVVNANGTVYILRVANP